MQKSRGFSWLDRAAFQSTYRWTLWTILGLSFVIMAIHLLAGSWENMSADPFTYLANILVRSLAGPLFALPFVLNYYRGKAYGRTYFGELDADAWGIATVLAGIIVLILMLCAAAAYDHDQFTAFYVLSMLSCMTIGIAYALARSLAILLAVQAMGCGSILLFASCAGLKACGYYIVVTSACYFLTWLVMFVCKAIVNPGKIRETTKRTVRRMGKYFLPEPGKKSKNSTM